MQTIVTKVHFKVCEVQHFAFLQVTGKHVKFLQIRKHAADIKFSKTFIKILMTLISEILSFS
jgi:hypothetical protein